LENSGFASSPTPKIISSRKKIIYPEDRIKVNLIVAAGKDIFIFFVSKQSLEILDVFCW